MNKAWVIGTVIFLGIAGLYLYGLYWTYYTEDGQIDSCLDQGGRWDYARHACEGAKH